MERGLIAWRDESLCRLQVFDTLQCSPQSALLSVCAMRLPLYLVHRLTDWSLHAVIPLLAIWVLFEGKKRAMHGALH